MLNKSHDLDYGYLFILHEMKGSRKVSINTLSLLHAGHVECNALLDTVLQCVLCTFWRVC